MCVKGQSVLDIGTGTGVLPRNMYSYGAQWTGADISPEQIEQAKDLSDGKSIAYPLRQKHLIFPKIHLTLLPPVSVFGILTMTFLRRSFLKYSSPGVVLRFCVWNGFRLKIKLPAKAKN